MFASRNAGFEALFGDYTALPRVYLPEDYSLDTEGLSVVKTMWVDFISDDPGGEVRWANELADVTGRPDGMIARVDFLDPELDRVLDAYASVGRVRCVRNIWAGIRRTRCSVLHPGAISCAMTHGGAGSPLFVDVDWFARSRSLVHSCRT